MTAAPTATNTLRDLAAASAAEAEAARRLPQPLVDAIADAGLFRLCAPSDAGGLEAPPSELIHAVAELARGDAAAGWCVAVNSTSGLLSGYLPPDAARAVHADPRTVTGGVFAPRGRATPVDGGFRVTGRWPFASGCQHCAFLMGGALVDDGAGGVQTLESGAPDVRLMLAPSAEFTIHDTWDTMGLRGTGSHDIELADVFVPDAMAASLFTDAPTTPGPLYAFPLFGLLAIAIGAVGIGIARGAIDDVLGLAGARVPTGGRRSVAERPTAQAAIAQAEAATRAAKALLDEVTEDAWAIATQNGEVPTEQRAALRLAAAHAVATAADVSEAMFRLGGGSAVYNSKSPLGRRLRDAQAASQHMLVAPGVWELTGRLLAGQPTDTSQL